MNTQLLVALNTSSVEKQTEQTLVAKTASDLL